MPRPHYYRRAPRTSTPSTANRWTPEEGQLLMEARAADIEFADWIGQESWGDE